ncbi:MAG: maleylpyruvate isomerase N-terminal domain-containing protein [Actinomycetota bacterium]|nr:maleylpyruvate isomerase N-terminal domain-containing protein [Actinomycetota bacterium]
MKVEQRSFPNGVGGRSREEDLARARAALSTVAPRLIGLIRAARHPEAVAVGDWRVSDVAAHLSYAAAGELMVARAAAEGSTEGLDVGEDIVAGVASFNASALEAEPERNTSVLADRIEKTVADFLATTETLRGDEPSGWLGGVLLPTSALACHLLEEFLIHGFDIAQAERSPWPIDSSHAALGFGFLLDYMKLCDPPTRRSFVNQQAAAGVKASYELRLRGEGRAFLSFENGNVEISYDPNSNIDCHVSGEPMAMMLSAFGRMSQTRAALTGRITRWGRKPWLAFRLNDLLRNP